MGPPPPAAARPARQSLAGGLGVGNRAAAPVARSASGRTSFAPKQRLRTGSERIFSIDSQLSGPASEGSGQSTGDEGVASPVISQDSLSPKSLSPVLSRTSAIDRQQASPASTKGTGPPTTQRPTGSSAAASREIEDLKTKCRVMEKKRMEDREKLKEMEKLRSDKEKLERVVQILQSNLQNKQQQITDLDKKWKESDANYESVKREHEDSGYVEEMAILDRELAEEKLAGIISEIDALKEKNEELTLELEILQAEKAEMDADMSPEEKESKGWLQMERDKDRLREALIRLRDMTQEKEFELNAKIKSLESDLQELIDVEEQLKTTKEKLAQTENHVGDLKQQLDAAETNDELIQSLGEKNHFMSEEIEELKATIEDLESLRELNDELEINHVETEKELLEDLDFKDSLINEQNLRAAHQEGAMADLEYSLSRFRDLVTTLQSDLEDMRASHPGDRSGEDQ